MKKIFTLMFALGIMTVSFAQSGHFDRSDTKNMVMTQNHGGYINHDDMQKNEMIQKINRDFDFKIMQVNRNPYLRNGEKRREIKMLGQQRAEQIAQVNARFSNAWNNHFDNGYRK